MAATQPANPPAPALTVPEGFSLHSENSAHILLPNDNGAFLNPIQEFNRDVSIACITAWGELAEEARRKRMEEQAARPMKKKAKKDEADAGAAGAEQVKEGEERAGPSGTNVPEKKEPSPLKFTILEALSATGLRSIRYAKEIPNAKKIIANDLSPTAADAIRRNVEINGLGEQKTIAEDGTETITPARVVVNEGDACTLMYNHRTGRDRVEVVDLDPYGTASPFIDAAVQCVSDGGLLCVTCTDLSVLATINYPEKCFSNYGGVPLKAEYCHEAALRLVLHSISTSAARYGRYIQPLVSLSIDFYVRVFVRVKSSPFEVKKASINTATYYVCTSCQSFYEQPLGKLKTTVHESSGNVNHIFRTNAGPPVGDRCPECNSALHVAGPMWSGVIHDKEFIGKVLEHIEANETKYGTSARMKGMLTVAKEELDTPFYFSPASLSGVFHCVCPSLNDVASALLNAGHQVSRSHALAGSLKTTATRADVHDIFRSWVKKNPVNMKKLGEASPARVLLAKEPRAEADFKHHPKSVTKSSSVKLVRYQQNPTPNWGPGTKAGTGKKRKRPQEE